jgi:cytoskeletal protein RodZ
VGQFGEELRRERESRGVTLETISDRTKVITRYLTALENEKFDMLPGGILSKGIVRGYARTVGLDESVWVERFIAATGEKVQNEGEWVAFVENVGKTREQSRKRNKSRLRWGVFVLLLLLGGAGWAVWRYMNGRMVAVEAQQHAVSSAAAAAPVGSPSQ